MYPSTAELVAASTVTELTGLESPKQDALRQEAILAIEGQAGQSFTAEGTDDDAVTRTLDGSGSTTLYLPKRLAILSDLSVLDGSLDATSVALSEDHDCLEVLSLADGSTWAMRAIAGRDGRPERVFVAGSGAVTVSGVWGWADAEYPEAITTALRYDMEDRALANAHALSETVRSARALGLESVDQGGLSIVLGSREPGVSTRVERLLADYIWSSSAGSLA